MARSTPVDAQPPTDLVKHASQDDRANTIVATAAFVSEIDDIQCGIGQGPCITVAREGQTVMSGSLGSDPRWRNRGPVHAVRPGKGTPSGCLALFVV